MINNTTRRRRKQTKGVPNKLDPEVAAALVGDDTGTEWGPAMKVLSDRHKAFVLALYQIKPGYGAHVKAAKLAGFGTSTSSAKSWSTIAASLAHDERILGSPARGRSEAHSCQSRRVRFALCSIWSKIPSTSDHCRAIGMVLDRVHPVETRHTVDVVHHVDHDAEAVRWLRHLKKQGAPREMLEKRIRVSPDCPGTSVCSSIEDAKQLPGPQLIEGTATELKDAS